MKNTKKVMLLNGLARAGKDTTAKIMQEELLKQGKTVKVLAFADKLKDMVCEMFNLTREQLDDYKNNSDRWGVHLMDYEEDIDYQPTEHLTDFRTFLDTFGNKIAKTLGGDSIWADIVLKQVQESDCEYFIISDYRFPIEFLVFEEYNFEWYEQNSDVLGNYFTDEVPFNINTIQIQRDGIKKLNLESAKSLDGYSFDYTINNNSDLENLKEQVNIILNKIVKGDN